MLGAQVLFELDALRIPEVSPEKVISISKEDFGKNAVSVNEDDEQECDEEYGVTFFLDNDLDESSRCELHLSGYEHEEEEFSDLALDIRKFIGGFAAIHILEDDDGEDVFLNPNHIALVEFKTSDVNSFFINTLLVDTNNIQDYLEMVFPDETEDSDQADLSPF